MTPLYIIPARGGSKGIPYKNIKLLGGKPLIAYTIEVAMALSKDLDHIILSTEDEEIANTAIDCGLPVPYRRPAEFATDTSGSREVILDAMYWADSNNIKYDCIVLLQPTSPFRTKEDVEKCLHLYIPDIDMVVSVTEASTNPYYNCYETDSETGYIHISKGEGTLTRRQEAPPAYEFNGAVYVMNPESIRREPMGKFKKRIPMVMPREASIDLDTPMDWIIAETIIKLKTSGTSSDR